MAGGNYNHGFLRVRVGGRDITELIDVDIPEPEGGDIQAIFAGGSRAIGHRFNTTANAVAAGITTAHPSSDEKYLDGLSALKGDTTFTFDYEDPEELPDGALIGFTSGQVKVSRGGTKDFTESPGAREYQMNCIGYTCSYKNAGTITVDATGQVSVSDA